MIQYKARFDFRGRVSLTFKEGVKNMRGGRYLTAPLCFSGVAFRFMLCVRYPVVLFETFLMLRVVK